MDRARRAFSSLLAVLLKPLRDAPPLLCVAAGLCLGDALSGCTRGVPLALLVAGGVAGVLLLFAADIAWRRGALALLAVTCGSVAAGRVYRPTFPPDHIAVAPMRHPVKLEGVLTADADAKGSGGRLSLSVERIDDGHGARTAQGQVSLTLHQMQHPWHAGDLVRLSASLRRPRNFGSPGEFDYEGYLARRGVYVTAFADDDSQIELLGATEGWLAGGLARWRRGVGALFQRTLPERQAAVLSALIVGTMSGLPDDVRRAFSRAGVSHVLSISGLHVGLVAATGYAAFRWLLARSRRVLLATNVPKLAVALSVAPVLLYAGIAGSNVATTRSVIMILVFLGAVIVDRHRHLLVSLAFAATVILLSTPGAALDISFQLSFVAVLGLVLGMERFWTWWKQWEEDRLVRLRGRTARLWRPLAVYVVVSVSALAATTPLTALHFNQVSLVAPLANAVVVPVLGSAAVMLGLLAAMAYTISEPLAVWCTVVAGPFVQLGLWLVDACAALPYAALHVVTPTALELGLVYAGLLVLVRTAAGRTRVWGLTVLAFLALGDGAWWWFDRYDRSDLRITFLSIGQGDSAVVEFPGAEVMVIDGGGVGGGTFDVGEHVVAPFLWSRKIAHVDYLVLSHPDWDHYGGLEFLASYFSPREFWSSGAPARSPRFAALERVLNDHHVQRVVLHRGAQRRIGTAQAAISAPSSESDGGRGLSRTGETGRSRDSSRSRDNGRSRDNSRSRDNNQSLVLTLSFGGRRVLFTGDIEADAEHELVAVSDSALASDILKVPHHGSRTSSTASFLNAIGPQLAVISVGFENRFGFPHRDVLQRYAARQCLVARTDLDGAVQVRVSAQGNIVMHSYRDTVHRSVAAHSAVDSLASER